jgi:2-dehydro-3-deoxyphosphogluconate aldolase/(4S)-4-hydroxy-2-oxoglutarate aldolase
VKSPNIAWFDLIWEKIMSREEVLEQVKKFGLLAVIRGPSPDLTVKMVDALIQGGVLGIEITYSTPNAEEVVRALAARYGAEIVLGMGTLTQPEQADRAKNAGAHFLVSPICEPALIKAMIDSGLLSMAGALTPTEVYQAYRLGADVVKVFPGSLVGPEYIKALKGPFPYIPMMPTGGVDIDNIAEWFKAGVVAVGAGSQLCPPDLARAGKFDEITRKAAEFIKIVKSSRP